MRYVFLISSALTAALILTACSESSSESKTPVAEKPLEPITGRQAFQYTFAAARVWSPDAAPLRVRSIPLEEVKAGGGKGAAWEITYVSAARGAAKVYTWCAIEGQGSLHKGVYAGREESWSANGHERPFVAAALTVDTTQALKSATAKSAEYLNAPGEKPPVSYLLESTGRFPNPTWRVMWGASVGSAEHQVFVDATTGSVVSKQ